MGACRRVIWPWLSKAVLRPDMGSTVLQQPQCEVTDREGQVLYHCLAFKTYAGWGQILLSYGDAWTWRISNITSPKLCTMVGRGGI